MSIANAAKGWRRLFSGSEKQAAAQELEVGDRFFEVAPPHSVWAIDRFVKSQVCTIPHVVIERTGTMPASKIISVQVLLDPGIFRRDRRDVTAVTLAPVEVAPDKRRRKSDLPYKGDAH